MFTHGVQLDVFHHDHFAIFGGKQSVVDNLFKGLVIASGEEFDGFGRPLGGIDYAGTGDIVDFSDDGGIGFYEFLAIWHGFVTVWQTLTLAAQ